MSCQPLEQPHPRPDFGVEVSPLDLDDLPESVEGDAVAGVEFDLLDPGVADGGDVAVFVAEFEHRGPFSHAA